MADPGGSGHLWPDGFPFDVGSTAICVDFDGTLAPIVDDPSQARPLEGVPELLASLAGRYGRVCVVSGRPASFLLAMLGTDCAASGVFIAGLYGLEWVEESGEIRRSPQALQWEEAIEAVTARAVKEAPCGVEIEPKGLSVTLHWRRAQRLEEARRWAEDFASDALAMPGLEAQPGRMSIELRPRIGGDKGTVVEGVARGMTAAVFLGDDMGDLPAFVALERLAGAGLAVLKVAVSSLESPSQLLARADLIVEGPDQAMRLLESLP